MRIAFISDIHIKKPGDKGSQCLERFCENELVLNSEEIYFLGDIFDFLVGEHSEHFEYYSKEFGFITSLLSLEKKVYFIQGNHDFHFQKTFLEFLKKNVKHYSNFIFLENGHERTFKKKKVYICHGDEVDFYNKAFKRWKKIYTASWFNYLVSKIFSYKFLIKLGSWASQNSKNRGKKTFDYELMKEKYIRAAKALLGQKKVDIIIAGHTHILENQTYDDGRQYINNGHPVKDNKFILLEDDSVSLKSL